MGTGSLGRRAHEGRLIRAFVVFMLALILWLLVMLTLLSADASLLVDLSSRLKASYGIDFLGDGMGSLKLSIIADALRDSGDGSTNALLDNPVPTATDEGGGIKSSPTPTSGLEGSIPGPSPTPTATGSSASTSTPSPTPTLNDNSSEKTPSPTPSSTTDGATTATSSPTPSQTPTLQQWPQQTPTATPTATFTYTAEPPTPTNTLTPPPDILTPTLDIPTWPFPSQLGTQET